MWKWVEKLFYDPDKEMREKLIKNFMDEHERFLPKFNEGSGHPVYWTPYAYKSGPYHPYTGECLGSWVVGVQFDSSGARCGDYQLKYDPVTHEVTTGARYM